MAEPSIHCPDTAVTIRLLRLAGSPRTNQHEVQVHTRPGVDGHAYRLAGRRAEPFELAGLRDCRDDEHVRITNELSAMVGHRVDLVDEFDVPYPGVVLLRFDLLPDKGRVRVGGAVGGVRDAGGESGPAVLLAFTVLVQLRTRAEAE